MVSFFFFPKQRPQPPMMTAALTRVI